MTQSRLSVTPEPSWASDTKSGHMRFNTLRTDQDDDYDWLDSREEEEDEDTDPSWRNSNDNFAYNEVESNAENGYWDTFADDFEYGMENDVSLYVIRAHARDRAH